MIIERLIVACLICATFSASGCAAYSRFTADRAQLQAARTKERAQYREIERDARVEERQHNVQQASVSALAEEACRDRQREALKDQIKEDDVLLARLLASLFSALGGSDDPRVP